MSQLVGLLASPFTSLFRQLRRFDLHRGSIDMTDARTLWEQAEQMREELSARISQLEAKVEGLLAEIGSLRILLAEALAREGVLQGEVRVLTERIRQLSGGRVL